MRTAFAAICLASLLPLTALAEPEETDELTDDGRPIQYQKVSSVDFETVKVGAGLVKPGVVLNTERKPGDYDSLVLLRENWDAELVESLPDVW